MTHFARTQSDGTWVNGYVVPATDFADLDTKTFKSINGDDGGTWDPSASIVIAGSGVLVTGPTTIWGGPGTLTPVSGARWQLGDNDWPVMPVGHAGNTRVLVSPFYPATTEPVGSSILRLDYAARQMVAGTFTMPDGTTQRASLFVPLRTHHAAVISSAAVTFRVSTVHMSMPTLMPRARVVRVTPSGIKTPLTSVAAGGDANGWVTLATPASVSAYYAGGGVQTLTVPCDQNNVVDKTAYHYVAEVQDESGIAGVPWTLEIAPPVAVVATGTLGSPLTGVQTIDGLSVSSQRVLVTAQNDQSQNGIWYANASAWTRDLSCSFSYGLIVPVLQGLVYTGLALQLITNGVVLTGGVPTRNEWRLSGAVVATGNIWHAVALTHTGIASTQWQ